MPKQIQPLLPSLLLLLLGLVLHRLLAHGLLAARLELLVDLLELVEPLLFERGLGLEVCAEPALDALHAVWAQHVSALQLAASTTFVERSDILQTFAGHLPVSLLPACCVSGCLSGTVCHWGALHVTGLLLRHCLEDSLP
jgi:hypothetical protein